MDQERWVPNPHKFDIQRQKNARRSSLCDVRERDVGAVCDQYIFNTNAAKKNQRSVLISFPCCLKISGDALLKSRTALYSLTFLTR